MTDFAIDFVTGLRAVREQEPLIQCITNFVTVNDCANIILAAGGSPSMSHDSREVEESVQGVQALVCNLGAIEDVDAMILAGKEANRLGKPVVFDPVAAGRTALRRESTKRILDHVQCAVIRGNGSEIRFLAENQVSGRGVDAEVSDRIGEEQLLDGIKMVSGLAKRLESVIALSGAYDIISDGNRTMVLKNGCETMARVTGSGCMATALIGAFCGVMPQNCFAAACTAMAVMGVCGELAEEQRIRKKTGNGTFRTDLIDGVFCLTEEQLMEKIRYEIYKG